MLLDLQHQFPEISGLRLELNGKQTTIGDVHAATFSQDFMPDDSTRARISVSSDTGIIAAQFWTLFVDLTLIAIFTLLLPWKLQCCRFRAPLWCRSMA